MTPYNYQGPIPHEQRPPRERIAKCGTLPGYKRHKRLKEDVCDPCRRANINECRERRKPSAEEDRIRARFAYFRDAEALIDVGPEANAA